MENLTELIAERLTDLGVRVAERAMTDGGADLRVVVPTRDGDRTVGVDWPAARNPAVRRLTEPGSEPSSRCCYVPPCWPSRTRLWLRWR